MICNFLKSTLSTVFFFQFFVHHQEQNYLLTPCFLLLLMLKIILCLAHSILEHICWKDAVSLVCCSV
jgi:hypothetical protein